MRCVAAVFGFVAKSSDSCFDLAGTMWSVIGIDRNETFSYKNVYANALRRNRTVYVAKEIPCARTLVSTGIGGLDRRVAIVDPQTAPRPRKDRVAGELLAPKRRSRLLNKRPKWFELRNLILRILIARKLDDRLVRKGLGDLVVYRPELANDGDMVNALREHRPHALIVGDDRLDEGAVSAWREVSAGGLLAVLERSGNADRPLQAELTARYGVTFHVAPPAETSQKAGLAALRYAEAHLNRGRLLPGLEAAGLSRASARNGGKRGVILVGAGIVNLISAWELVRAGYDLTIIDAAPDPRTRPNWLLLGATHGGGNARMFSLTEADNYNEKGSMIYSGMDCVLRQRISEGGWLARDPAELTEGERRWLAQFDAVPTWLAEVFTQDIYDVNRESLILWDRLREDYPALFEGVGYVGDILRIYSEAQAYEAALILQSDVGALKRELPRAEVARRYPAFIAACERGEIVGGLDAIGFTLNIHDFAAGLIKELEMRGVKFSWGVRMERISTTTDGLVDGLETNAGFKRADHYVLSPGAYCRDALAGTRAEGKVQGILGLWLTLPNLEPLLSRSVKLHREGHVGEDSNITLARDAEGRPVLLLGSGYGFVGERAFDPESGEIAVLFEALEQTAQRYLPRNYARALADGSLSNSRKACVRPFTTTGLGIFEVLRAAEGGRMVITTGHNTGGFTQAPSVAKAVVATLDGLLHPMQWNYDPERGFSTAV